MSKFFSTVTTMPKITKNRYEILFFNKESISNIISKSSNIENSSIENNLKNSEPFINNQNEEFLMNSKNTEVFINSQNAENIAKIIEDKNKNTKNLKINFNNLNKTSNKIKYDILKKFCYLRMYFRYTDDNTLNERFKINGKKNFNYIKKYNNAVIIKLITIFEPLIIKLVKNKIIFKKYTEKQITDAIEIIKDKYKKIDNTSNNEINNILNKKVSSEEDHYKNIKKVLEILKNKSNGYINYFIILDIKKSKVTTINSINKKTNSNNTQFGGNFGSIGRTFKEILARASFTGLLVLILSILSGVP